MKIRLVEDEFYPYFYLNKVKDGEEFNVDIPKQMVDRYRKAQLIFEVEHQKLNDFLNKEEA